jgi:hypothetical protein
MRVGVLDSERSKIGMSYQIGITGNPSVLQKYCVLDDTYSLKIHQVDSDSCSRSKTLKQGSF